MVKAFVCNHCDQDGHEIPGTGCGVIPHVVFSGCTFGGRLLEDVMFKAFINTFGGLSVSSVADWEADGYLCQLSQSYWMYQALEYAMTNDIAECPKCGGDVDAQPREIKE